MLAAVPVGMYIDNGAPLNSASQRRVKDALHQHSIPEQHAPRVTVMLGDAHLDIFPPPPGVDTAQNNHSLVVLVQRGRFRALLTGDSERSEIEALLVHDSLAHVDVLKAPHHGDPEHNRGKKERKGKRH